MATATALYFETSARYNTGVVKKHRVQQIVYILEQADYSGPSRSFYAGELFIADRRLLQQDSRPKWQLTHAIGKDVTLPRSLQTDKPDFDAWLKSTLVRTAGGSNKEPLVIHGFVGVKVDIMDCAELFSGKTPYKVINAIKKEARRMQIADQLWLT
jgi:hypothetical protein